MDTVAFVGAKGGVGTSTVAVLHALTVAAAGLAVRLVSPAHAGIEDLAALLGVATPAFGQAAEVGDGLSLGPVPHPEAYNVIDVGLDAPPAEFDGTALLVVSNDYLCFRRALDRRALVSAMVYVDQPGRALGRADAEDLLNLEVVGVLAATPSLGRLIDAGLLASGRAPRLHVGTRCGLS